jgi:hypothetical protein
VAEIRGGQTECAHDTGYAYFLRFGSYIRFPSNAFFDHSEFTFSLWLKAMSAASL